MVYLNQNELNYANVTCSRNKNLTGSVTYLWTMRHKLSQQSWKFIPYRVPPVTVGYEPAYDQFEIETDLSSPEVYIGSSGTPVNLQFIPGEYYLKIYEQVSTTNLNPALSYDVVYEGMVVVNDNVSPINQIAYTGVSDTVIIYQN